MDQDTNADYDPLQSTSAQESASANTSPALSEEARRIQAKTAAFRDLADRFYMLWWNLPSSDLRAVDRELQDLFRMFMDLAPSFGVSRNGIPELRECCGRKRTWKDDAIPVGSDQILVMSPVKEKEEDLGWCPGDIIRRITRFFGAQYCEKCDGRRRAINAFFRCGK